MIDRLRVVTLMAQMTLVGLSGLAALPARADDFSETLAAFRKAGSTGATAGANVGGAPAAKVVGAYVNGMAVFTLVKGGLMHEATIGGQKFKFTKR